MSVFLREEARRYWDVETDEDENLFLDSASPAEYWEKRYRALKRTLSRTQIPEVGRGDSAVARADDASHRHVHNHGPEEGPSLACKESPIGDCIRFGAPLGQAELRAAWMACATWLYDREHIGRETYDKVCEAARHYPAPATEPTP